MKKKYFFLIIVIIIIVIGLAILIIRKTKKNEYDSMFSYYEQVGISDKGSLSKTYDNIVQEIGLPLEENEMQWKDRKRKELIFDEFKVFLYASDEKFYFYQVVIFGENIRFGDKSIGVGSSKKEIERAYYLCAKITGQNEYDLMYADGTYGVGFVFDDQNNVKEMVLGTRDFY